MIHPRDMHGVGGRLEHHNSPYSGFGAYGADGPDIVHGGIAEAVARATCLAASGSWDATTKQCMSATVPQPGIPAPPPIPIDPAAQLCATVGGFWDPVNKSCGTTAPPPKEDNTTLYIVLGVVGIGAIYLLSKKKR